MNKIIIKNNYHKRLSFPMGHAAFSIGAGEIKTVNFSVGSKLLKNGWISEVGSKKVAENVKIAGCSSCQQKPEASLVKERIKEKDTKLKMKISERKIKGRQINKSKTR